MTKRLFTTIIYVLFFAVTIVAQQVTVAGKVVDENSRQPIEFASILMKESGRWAITDSNGNFSIKGVSTGKTTMVIQCLGYATQTLYLTIAKDIPKMQSHRTDFPFRFVCRALARRRAKTGSARFLDTAIPFRAVLLSYAH